MSFHIIQNVYHFNAIVKFICDKIHSFNRAGFKWNNILQEIAGKVTNSLVNIRAITAHFNPKIEAWLTSQQLSTPTEDQILEVVKSNYDSLTLKLQVN